MTLINVFYLNYPNRKYQRNKFLLIIIYIKRITCLKNSKPEEDILFLIDYHYYYNSNNNRVDIIHFYVTILF